MTACATTISADRALGYRCHQVLALVRLHIAERGIAPSYSMIRDELGLDTKGDVSKIVARLERRALLRRVGTGRVRRIRLVTPTFGTLV